jgi:acyl CoA:acetate/3-ketoacid CoA transferase beta subunit
MAIAIPGELHARIRAFRPVVEAVLEETISDEDYIALLLDRALPLMLAEVVPHEVPVLLQSLQGLAARHPAEVYGYVADVLKGGAATIDWEAQGRRIGFQPTEPEAMLLAPDAPEDRLLPSVPPALPEVQ